MKHYALRFLKQKKIYASYKLIGNYTAYTLIIWLIIFVILCKRCSRYFKIWKRLHIFVQSSFHLKEINVNWLGAIKQLVSYIRRFLSFCSDFKKKWNYFLDYMRILDFMNNVKSIQVNAMYMILSICTDGRCR